MNLDKHELETLTKLEESLWIAASCYDAAYMERVLHADFIEFGCSGRIYDRETIISVSGNDIKAKLPFDDFVISQLSDTVVQITYISEVQYDVLQVCNRCSIWLKTSDGWQLRFHQGTPRFV